MISFRAILDFIFPRKCSVCTKSGSFFCDTCARSAPAPFQQINNWTISLFQYKNSHIRNMIWSMKYKNAHAIAQDIATYMHDELVSFIGESLAANEDEKIILIPIPLSKERLHSRGFNQSEILAKEIANQNKELFILEKNTLIKIRDTEPQAKIKNKTKRSKKHSRCFCLHSSRKNKKKGCCIGR